MLRFAAADSLVCKALNDHHLSLSSTLVRLCESDGRQTTGRIRVTTDVVERVIAVPESIYTHGGGVLPPS